MYEMATGRLPFSAEDTSAVSRMHIEKTPMRPRVLDPEIPKGLEQIILHAMEKTPFMRFSDANSMLDAVKTLVNDMNTVFEFNRSPEEGAGGAVDNRQSAAGTRGWDFVLLGALAAFVIVLIVTIILVVTLGGKNICDEVTGFQQQESDVEYGI